MIEPDPQVECSPSGLAYLNDKGWLAGRNTEFSMVDTGEDIVSLTGLSPHILAWFLTVLSLEFLSYSF